MIFRSPGNFSKSQKSNIVAGVDLSVLNENQMQHSPTELYSTHRNIAAVKFLVWRGFAISMTIRKKHGLCFVYEY